MNQFYYSIHKPMVNPAEFWILNHKSCFFTDFPDDRLCECLIPLHMASRKCCPLVVTAYLVKRCHTPLAVRELLFINFTR